MKFPLFLNLTLLLIPTLSAQNLLTNGDLEQGNIGFSSQYLFSENTAAQETYAVSANPQTNQPLFASMGDHTTGTGQMLVVNGSTSNDAAFAWRQEVDVLDGSNYDFTFWGANLFGSSPSMLIVRINGEQIGELVEIMPQVGVWNEYSRSWTAEDTTTAVIEISFSSTAFSGNDTAFDDFSFTRTGPASCINPDELPDGAEVEEVAIGIVVPGNANPFLAGQPDGVSTKSDRAPNQSPVEALAVSPGETLIFGAEGSVSFGGGRPTSPEDGVGVFPSASALGIAGYTTPSEPGGSNGIPANALVGVFLSELLPVDPAPDSLLYPDGLAFEIIAPAVQQIFFIGDGLTGDGEGVRQQFIVPEGATRLFLGTSDGFGWFNNSGEFMVDICRIKTEPQPGELGPTTIGFDQALYEVELGTEVSGKVEVDPLPAGGIYSQGMLITVRNAAGDFAGAIAPTITPILDNDGPLGGMASQLSTEVGMGALKGTASFSTDRQNLNATTLATFSLTDLTPGEYDLGIVPWNQLGPTEDIFVTGLCQTLDPFITFTAAKVSVIGSVLPEVTIEGDLALDRQTSLINQSVTVTNNTGRTINGFRLFVTDLPEGARLWNAHGTVDGVPYIDIFQSLAPGETLEILLEYYRANRQANFTPTFTLGDAVGTEPEPDGSAPLSLDLRILSLDTRGLMIEFLSGDEQSYTVEYSDDMLTWKVSSPSLTGTGERLQWIDAGPPKTDSFPAGGRFYRIIKN